jgi:hypothetical protein
VHDRAQALAATEEAAQAFDTFNLDIMYALPGQSLDDWQTGHRYGAGFKHHPHIDLPPHDRAQHLFRQVSAPAA